MGNYNEIVQFFPERLRWDWELSGLNFQNVQEIRLRANQPVRVLCGREEKLSIRYGERELEEIFRYLCHDSVYAYEEERKQGYLIAKGGHRIGITGELAITEGNRYIAKYIRYINIRFAHEHKNIADGIIEYCYNKQYGAPFSILIISPPGIGKTTLLRDIIRMLSNGRNGYAGCNIGVIDERGEIAGAYRGSAVLDCGERTDVITGGDKQQGISVLVRAFSPRVIAIDEIGGAKDAQAIFYAGVSGCSVIATVHGSSLEDIQRKAELSDLIMEGIFQRFILLSMDPDGRRYAQVFEGGGKALCGKRQLQVSV